MEKPVCKICGHKHYGMDHIWTDSPTDEVPGKKGTKTDRPKGLKAGRPQDVPGEKKPFDRKTYQREYMREYMRKRRAKPKEET